jgi:hypothetical protein
MNQAICRQLDDYLAHGLSDAERAEFAAHVADCPACRQSVQDQQRMDQLLVQATIQLQAVPAGLTRRIEQRLLTARRLRFARWAAGLAAAISLMGITAWLLTREPPVEVLPYVPIVEAPSPRPAPEMPDPRSLVRVAFPPQAAVLAVPMKTENPNVTIIWVYPTVPTAAEPKAIPSLERNGT